MMEVVRAVAILAGGGVRRFTSLRRLEAFMGREVWLVATIGRADRAAVEECQALWRAIGLPGGDIGPPEVIRYPERRAGGRT